MKSSHILLSKHHSQMVRFIAVLLLFIATVSLPTHAHSAEFCEAVADLQAEYLSNSLGIAMT